MEKVVKMVLPDRSVVIDRPTTLTICREDINNPMHPFLFEEFCEQLGFSSEKSTCIESLELSISSVRGSE